MKKSEVWAFVISSIIIGFVFSFRSWGLGEFSVSEGLSNWFLFSVLGLITLLIHHLGILIIARKYHCKITYKLWVTQNKIISNLSKFKKFYSGIIIPLIFAFFSNGFLKVPTTGTTEIKETTNKRVKTKYKYISEYERGLVHLAGPLANLFLALILTSIDPKTFSNLIEINYFLTIFTMLPIGNFDGTKVLLGSKILYLFSVIFIIFSIALINLTDFWATIFLAIIIAIIFVIMKLYKDA